MTDVALQRPLTGFSRLGRFLLRAPMFPVFALGCSLLILAVPWLHITVREPRERIRKLRAMARMAARGWFVLLRRLHIVAIETRGAVPDKPGLVIANHPTLIDVVMLVAFIPNLCCVMKAQLKRNGLLNTLARQLGYVSNQDPETMLADCEQRLTDGEILLIFPEATRSTPGQPISFRTGAAELALRTQAPLTTAIIHANTPYLSKSSAWYDFPAERLEYRIVFEPPFTTSSRTGSRRQRRRNLTARLETFYRQALGQVQKSTTADDWPDTHIKEQT